MAGFGFDQLRKCGWKEGQGLGKQETGIAEPIKVKIKQDRLGVGSDVGEEFNFQWWQHVFNNAANNITVENDEVGEVTVLRKEDDFGPISNKRTAHQNHRKNKKSGKVATSCTYTNFVQTSTFYNGQEATAGDRSPPASDSEGEGAAVGTIPSDQDLYRACGGLTAHKAARHGLTLSGKLLRVDRQERGCTAESGDRSLKSGVREMKGKGEGGKSKARKVEKKRRKKLLEHGKDSKKMKKDEKRKNKLGKDSKKSKKDKKKRKINLTEINNKTKHQ